MTTPRSPFGVRLPATRLSSLLRDALPRLLSSLIVMIAVAALPGAARAQYGADCTPLTIQKGQTAVIPIQVVDKGVTTDIVPLKTGEFAFDKAVVTVSPKEILDAVYGEVHVRAKKEGTTPLLIDLPDLGFGLLYDITVVPDYDKELQKAIKDALKELKKQSKDLTNIAVAALKEQTTAVKKAGEGFDMLAAVKAAQDARVGGQLDVGDAGAQTFLDLIHEAQALLAGEVGDRDKGPGLSRGACDTWDDAVHDIHGLVNGSAGKIDKAWKKFQDAVNKSGTHGLSSVGHFHFDGGAFPGPRGTDTDFPDPLIDEAIDQVIEAVFASNLVPLPTPDDPGDGEGGGLWHSISGGRMPNSDGDVTRRITFLDGSTDENEVPTDAGGRWSDCEGFPKDTEAMNFLELLREATDALSQRVVNCSPISGADGDQYLDPVGVGLLD